MAIKPQFTRSELKRRFDRILKEIENAQIDALADLGEKCVNHAKELPPEIGFHDRTGNLRSSIGYVVFKNGVAIRSNYVQVLEGSEGVKAGQQLAEQVGSGTKGIVLVVTAGMNYAAALEANGAWKIKSKRSYDVLASAELLAQRELPKILSKLVTDIKSSVK